MSALPLLRDRPDEREPLLRLDSVLQAIERAGVRVPSPRTWVLELDDPLPHDLSFPLFLRTAETSMKKGGRISRVRNSSEPRTEAAELRRVLGWDAVILAREWLDLEPADDGHDGPVPREVRVWVVGGEPVAWSFHSRNRLDRSWGSCRRTALTPHQDRFGGGQCVGDAPPSTPGQTHEIA